MNNLMFLNFEMFSLEHFITIGVIIAIILVLFFTRKFFIKYKYLDLAMRLLLAFLIVGSEIKLRAHPATNSVIRNFPIPFCGHLLWIAGLALVSNSSRIYKAIYPLCILGATLSMIVVEGIPNFPEFRAWQYFLVHGGFLIGAFYFVFTRKINKFTWKDMGISSLLISAMGALFSIFVMLGIRDEYMIIKPVPQTQGIYDLFGQTGYTIIFMLFVAVFFSVVTLFTNLATRKRTDEMENVPSYKHFKWLDKASTKYNKNIRWKVLTAVIAFTTFMLVDQDFAVQKNLPEAKPMMVIAVILMTLSFLVIIINEFLHNYDKTIK